MQQLESCLYYPTNPNLDRLCQILVQSEDPEPLIQRIVESRRLKSLYGQISIRKRKLLSEIQDLYAHIQTLQKETVELHQHISMFEETISFLFPHLPSAWQEKFTFEEDQPDSSNEQLNRNNEQPDNINEQSDSSYEQPDNINEQPDNSNENENVQSSHKKKKKKKKHQELEKSTVHQNLSKHDFLHKWRKNYYKLDFDALKSKKNLITEHPFCESVKLMEQNVIRKRYDLNNSEHKKAFKREVAIYKYLNLCRFVPPLLHINPTKGTIYIPYCGTIAKPKDKNRIILRALMRVLSQEWGVTLESSTNINQSNPRNSDQDDQLNWLLINKEQSHHYIFDFSHPNWKVEPKR